jgi:DNA-binding transcriptional ArsR family regulator
MKVGPDVALVAALIGDPARANILTALMGGQALTAGELAREAGITAQTASAHLARLQKGGLVVARRQGRNSYFALSGDDIAGVLEAIMGVAARTGHHRTRPGPREPALRTARVCYDHLAGDLGVELLDGLITRGVLVAHDDRLELQPGAEPFLAGLGIDLGTLRNGRRAICKGCLDWSVRRTHLAGALGAAFLDRFFKLGWAKRLPDSRAVQFTSGGLAAFRAALAPATPAGAA